MAAPDPAEIAFEGEVCTTLGRDTIVSFPGMYAAEWNGLVEKAGTLTVKKFIIEAVALCPLLSCILCPWSCLCAPYLLLKRSISTACVFLPRGDNRHGQHEYVSSVPGAFGFRRCHCGSLYGSEQPWGCSWFSHWKANVQRAVKRNHKLIVVYKRNQVGQGKKSWPPRETDKNRPGLGASQTGEVAWLDLNMIPYEEIDIDEFVRRFGIDTSNHNGSGSGNSSGSGNNSGSGSSSSNGGGGHGTGS